MNQISHVKMPLLTAATFDGNRKRLAELCALDAQSGSTLAAIAKSLNAEGLRTKTGKEWKAANVCELIKNPNPPAPKPLTKTAIKRKKRESRKLGHSKSNDLTLEWVKATHPELERWRLLSQEWLEQRENAVQGALTAVNHFLKFLAKHQLPTRPAELLFYSTKIADFYDSTWGKVFTHGKIDCNNQIHNFLQWVLSRPEFCEEDDDGRLQTSPAFRNPVQFLSRSGLPRGYESVRSTLPYGYIEELRLMIAQGPNFRDWQWAQNALGQSHSQLAKVGKRKNFFPQSDNDLDNDDEDETDDKVAPVWYEVNPEIIDESDPDCVWRTRTRAITGARDADGNTKYETIFEMWSPVRWVALLNKLQLPLRTFQVRMLDSGEADTWQWKCGKWVINENLIALGTEAKPYTNGVFRRPSELIDGNAHVILHINTNKTADKGKAGNHKGYNVPWLIGGPIHQDPFYWYEKLRNWQAKYNPIEQLTKWSELDGRYLPKKASVQLAAYPDTAFLFRMPENHEHPDFPLATSSIDRPWYQCLAELELRLIARGESLPNGQPIRLVPAQDATKRKNFTTTLFPPHSLRVSLITALAIEGGVPLAILQKIAGHSRLVMTLYYTKPGAKHVHDALEKGLSKLSESSEENIVVWLSNAEYTQLVRDAICNSPESLKAAVPEIAGHRTPAGWMVMVDGLCLVGGNATETEAPGCHNGGPNIGSETAPRYAPVPGGARNCPRCRWFVTRPSYLPQLVARWNNTMYHCNEAKVAVLQAEERFREIEDLRAEAFATGLVFTNQPLYLIAQRVREQAFQKFDELTMNVAAITGLIEQCRLTLNRGDGTSLISGGSAAEVEFAIHEVESELLQLSGVCEDSELYADLDIGKAALRRSQLLDVALLRDDFTPAFLHLSEEEQKLVGNAFLRQLASQMNPSNPALGHHEIISLIDAGLSLRERLGLNVEHVFDFLSAGEGNSRRIPINLHDRRAK